MNTPESGGIVTVTLNPAIDETIVIDTLHAGSVNRALSRHRQAGGKGVNISSMLAQYGIRSTATGFLGDANPELFERLFRDLGIDDRFIRIPGETRTSLKLVEPAAGRVTDINLPGETPSRESLIMLENLLRESAAPGWWFILSGRIPPGVDLDTFVRLLEIIRSGGGMTAVDTSGPALKTAIAFGVDLIKPNRHELAEALDMDAHDTLGLIQAARNLHTQGIPHVILSLGEGGAMFSTADGHCVAGAPPVRVVSTVGAGDSLLAGYLAGMVKGLDLPKRAALATAFAWSAVEHYQRQLAPATEINRRTRMILADLIRNS